MKKFITYCKVCGNLEDMTAIIEISLENDCEVRKEHLENCNNCEGAYNVVRIIKI
tara:strand:+ start:229 stop:393 length:165 start_codon:yes stop_codon:yes gene_type:complete